ncbi:MULTISPECIES: hypothetical protein [Actinosynnema]|uniref:hypothetical protein n=1 Tax=Actinosynnema TaxID=40566 RepID=UPI0020A2F9B8|nr:hypothetical protein [Actinosynnema pretiosum]MCP2098399.1 hypothetical protein [Actinosynnema pretiosum]
MTRRPTLPGASELFRSTVASQPATALPGEPDVVLVARPQLPPQPEPVGEPAGADDPSADSGRRGSGREKHSTKFTVYASDEELLALEQAKLVLRGSHGLVVDRGRVVREAIAIVLDDLEGRGDDSLLVRRLRER